MYKYTNDQLDHKVNPLRNTNVSERDSKGPRCQRGFYYSEPKLFNLYDIGHRTRTNNITMKIFTFTT